MQAVAETPIFTRQTEKLFSEDEKREPDPYGKDYPGTGVPVRDSISLASQSLVAQQLFELGSAFLDFNIKDTRHDKNSLL